jgi:hypothetical protein
VKLMTIPQDPYLQGRPFPPETPRDPNAGTVIPESERGEDEARDEYVDTLSHTPARPLSHDEEDAAEHDPDRPARVYAPASARVAKDPLPGDERLINAGKGGPSSIDEVEHPGDSSDPSELR